MAGKRKRVNGMCVNGHRMTQRNTYTRPNGYTVCRKCLVIGVREWRNRVKTRKQQKAANVNG